MAQKLRLCAEFLWLLGVTGVVLAGCVSAPGTYPDPNGPRGGTSFLVDPQTGLTLPGQPEAGGHR